MRPEPVRRRATLASPALAAASLAFAPVALADTATSASFQIHAGTLDTAGGRSTSASHVVTSCVGSEIAGSSSSASHRIDSGCGATSLAVVVPGGGPGGVERPATPVPALYRRGNAADGRDAVRRRGETPAPPAHPASRPLTPLNLPAPPGFDIMAGSVGT